MSPPARTSSRDDLGGAIPKVEDGPWPSFPADLTSIAVMLATQARGTILIFEKMFESRLFFVDKLVSMGARIILCDPHRVVITGPAKLYGQRMSSPDIRAGMAMLLAALCAEGRRRSATRTRSTRGTSASTSDCARSAPLSSGFRLRDAQPQDAALSAGEIPAAAVEHAEAVLAWPETDRPANVALQPWSSCGRAGARCCPGVAPG